MSKILIVDLSPIGYRWINSATKTAIKDLNIQKGEDGLYDFNEYKDIFIFKTLEHIALFKRKFQVDEIVLAIDSSPYWRLDYWDGYKYGRNTNDKSGINWIDAKASQREVIALLKEHSSFKVIDVKGAEGDDVGFVLTKELTAQGHEVIVKSLDHDWIYNLENPNTKYWETKHTVKDKECGWVAFNENDINTLKYEHCMFGDRGDYLLPVTYYSRFSDLFKEKYPKKTPLEVYPMRHKVDVLFKEKFGKSAYKQPPLGAISFYKKQVKEGFSTQEFLDRDPIYQMNYDLNKKLGLPDGIPTEIREKIIAEYNVSSDVKNNKALTDYFMGYGLIELIAHLPTL